MTLDIYFPRFAPFLLNGHQTPAFAKLCALGSWHRDEDYPVEASLCRQFGLSKQQDWPLALMSALGEGLVVDAAYLLLLHPANFLLQRDFFSFGEPLALSHDEKTTLIQTLNNHFTEDGFRLISGASLSSCYLAVKREVEVSTTLISQGMGRDVGPMMPQGKDGMAFQSLMNEAQMLLHEHPINQARERQGLPLVNSIWLSGGGAVDALPKAAHQQDFIVFANDHLSQGLAKWAGIACYSLTGLDEVATSGNDAVIVLEDAGDLERDWFAPLLKALQSRMVKNVRCHFDVHGMTYTLTLKPMDTWKFWKKTLKPESYFKMGEAG